jgi:two-component system, OmpR family, sensor histidine kinase KdpD
VVRSRVWAWLFWVTVCVVATAVLRARRDSVDTVHAALTYLLVILGGSVSGGRPLGLTLTLCGFLLIDYFFQLPYDTLFVSKPLDWIVLLAFLTTAVVATQLLTQERARAAEAERRAGEVTSLGRLGAEILSAGRAEEALAGIADLIRSSLEVTHCRIYSWDDDALRLLVASPSAATAERQLPHLDELRGGAETGGAVDRSAPDGSSAVSQTHDGDERTMFVTLQAHARTVGVLFLTDDRPITLDSARRRFLDALAYYAALVVERTRLVAKAEHAEALREADRLKDVVLASVSHDLRTPLTTIKALAQESALRGDRNALAIEEQADRLGHLVADLLDLSRLKGGAMPVHLELNTAEDLVGAAMRQMAGVLKDRPVETKVDFTEPALAGRFDFVQSLRILGNLLGNAVRYTPPASPVELSVHREGGSLVFAVADRGPGIPVAERDRIFEPFYRPAGAPADGGGAGLGLAIARRLAELQGGTLEYAARLGGGSRFVLRLPADTPSGVFVKS